MASLDYGSATSQLLHLGRSSPTCTFTSQCSAVASVGSSVARAVGSPASIRTPGTCLRERQPLRSATKMQFSRIACELMRNMNRGYTRDSLTGVPLVFKRDDPIFSLGDYEGDGPIELPPREIDIDPLAIPEASPVQIVASVFLTGTIALLLVRSLRRRAARSKDMQFRSSGVSTSKSIQEQAKKAMIDNLKKAPEVPLVKNPSPLNTAFGAVVAGIIALGLYKFTSTVEAGFMDKAVSRDYSIRNLTITVRTIITGICYLATFVFAANSIGLTLYSVQLLLGFGPPNPPPPTDPVAKEQSTEPIPDSSSKNVEAEDFSEK